MIQTLLFSGLVGVMLTGCGEEPTIRTYEVAKPVAYHWPKTEAREELYEDQNVAWVWDVPAGWVDAPEVPDQLVADYRFKGVDEELPGRMTVSVIDGDAGGVLANVARWRQQMFSMPVTGIGPRDVLSQPMPAPAGEVTIVELEGQYRGPSEPTYLLGAILRVPATDGSTYQSWFFKMVGDEATIKKDQTRVAFAKVFLSFRPKGAPPVQLPADFFMPELRDQSSGQPSDQPKEALADDASADASGAADSNEQAEPAQPAEEGQP